MRRINEDEVAAATRRGWVVPLLITVVLGAGLIWVVQHLSNGCTNFPDLFTYCSGSTSGVLITK